jgi:hypothetical protein
MTSQLLGLRAEQFKRLELVEVDFDGITGTYAVMGANEAGKSSMLDALESVLAGRKATKFKQPIRNDGEEARIVATFDDIVVIRTFKKDKPPTITVTGRDGRRFANTEEIIKSLYAHVALDPLAFSRLDDKEQVTELLGLIGYDPTKDDADDFAARAERTAIGRDRDAAKARRDAIPESRLVDALPADPVSIAGLSRALAEAVARNGSNGILKARAAAVVESAARLRSRVEQLRAELETAEELLEVEQRSVAEGTARVAGLVDVDIEPIQTAILSAETTNSNIAQRDERARLNKAYNAEVAGYEGKTKEIEAIAERKKKVLAETTMPVPNLSIDPDTNLLFLGGVPFSQASTGVKIRTGVSIAMALNPDLHLIIIRDASLLDAGNRKVINDLAKEHEFLVLMELADENAPVGVVITDGTVSEVRA